jgi:DNA helicase HerA-like ATPase
MTIKHPIPATALRESVAIIGRTGSGKTYAARGAVELLLREGARVCIIDPTGVWHGLRSSADGKSPGFSVVVFGGQHADVPIAESSGAALGHSIRRKDPEPCLRNSN